MNESLRNFADEVMGEDDTKKYIHSFGDTCIIITSERDEYERYHHVFLPVFKVIGRSIAVNVPVLILDSEYYFNDIEGAIEDIKNTIRLTEYKKEPVTISSLTVEQEQLCVWLYNSDNNELVIKHRDYQALTITMGVRDNTPRKVNGKPRYIASVSISQ